MKILNIEFIYLMLVPSFILLYLIITNKSEIERVFDKKILNKIKIDMGLNKTTKLFLLFFSLFLMILALSRPVIQKGVIEVETKKGTAVLALDISTSMLAKDIFPNRLEFAKKKMEEFIRRGKNLQIAIIAFAKDSFLVSPISLDKESILFLLENLDTNYITLQGTDILGALESANNLLKNEKIKNVVIFTDGGDKKNFDKEIYFAKKNGLRVFIVGIGTKKGAPIKIKNEYLKDKNQNIVITKLNENIKVLAESTGGEYIIASNSNEDIKKLIDRLSIYKKSKKEKIVDQIELFPYILGISLFLLFLLFFSIPSKRVFLLFVIFFSLNSKASIFDFKDIKKAKEYYEKKEYEKAVEYYEKVAKSKKSSQSYYDLANAYYKKGDYKKAIKYYNLVQTPNKTLRRYTLHNLGNCYFMLKDYKKAIEFYEKALKIEYDKNTKYNLDLAKKMLKKRDGSKNIENKKENKESKKGKNKDKKSEENRKSSSKKSSKISKNKKIKESKKKNEPISSREEKKWMKLIKKMPQKTLIYKVKTKNAGDISEKPW